MPGPCSAHAMLCCGLEKSLSERHGRGMAGCGMGIACQGAAWAWHGRGMACVNQTWPHCVNQMGKAQSKPLAARHGRGMGTVTAWERHGMCELAFILLVSKDVINHVRYWLTCSDVREDLVPHTVVRHSIRAKKYLLFLPGTHSLFFCISSQRPSHYND
jgi:hypothetical protein